MWIWILSGAAVAAAAAAAGCAVWQGRRRTQVDRDLARFVARLTMAIHAVGPEYRVRGVVPGAAALIVAVRGQEVAVPLDNVFQHDLDFPGQIDSMVRQLLAEIEEVGLEQPSDRLFADAAMQILPQVCPRDWVYANAPAFGDEAIPHRDLGPDLALCYVIDDPWAVVFVCNAHLRLWGRSEADLFHLANQNLRRRTSADVGFRSVADGPVRVHSGDGYDAARVLLLDPAAAGDLLIAMPERDCLWIGRQQDQASLESLLARDGKRRSEHPVSPRLYRFENEQLVPVSARDRESAGTDRTSPPETRGATVPPDPE